MSHPTSDSNEQLNRQLQESLDAAAVSFAESLRGKPPSEDNPPAENGYLLVNPLSFSQRQGVLLPELSETPETADAVRAAADQAAVIDLPSMGFAWIAVGRRGAPWEGLRGEGEAPAEPMATREYLSDPAARQEPRPPDTAGPSLAAEYRLRNEFVEINFDPATGAIQSVLDYKSRHPRLAQQIAFRMPQDDGNPAGDLNYTIMAADEIGIASSSSVLGEMCCRGRLMDRQGELVAGFRQTTRVWRGSRVIEIEIDLDPQRLPADRPWNSYYTCRFAWHDEDCDFFRSVNLANQPTNLTQLESPLFIDIRSGKLHTTILGGGLPYHRRIGPRKLDTLLIVPGETARTFRLGVAIDAPNPTAAALAFIAPRIKLFGPHKPPAEQGWLFHLDHRNVIATAWLPLALESSAPAPRGGMHTKMKIRTIKTQNGFRVRLLETEGRPAQLKLRCFRNVAAARKLETGDVPPAELHAEGDAVYIPMTPHQWIEVEVRFQA